MSEEEDGRGGGGGGYRTKNKTSHVNVGKNLERVMEEEREWKDKIKGTDWSFGAGCTIGGRLEGQERGLGGLFGVWAGNVE